MTNMYSIANEIKHNINGNTQKYLLYKQFLAWNCNSFLIAPLTDYANNQSNIPRVTCGKKNSASERLCFDLKASKGCTGKLENLRDDSEIRLKINVKAALTEKMRLRVQVYSRSECLSERGLTMKQKSCGIAQKKYIAA